MSTFPGVERCLLFTLSMSSPRQLGYYLDDLDQIVGAPEEIVIVTCKQYLAVADDLLRRFFYETNPALIDCDRPFTLLIKEEESTSAPRFKEDSLC